MIIEASTGAYVAQAHITADRVNLRSAPITCQLGRRELLAAGSGALLSMGTGVLAAGAIPISEAPPATIRKADQSKVGVSRVPIPKQGEGNKGAGIPSVKLDTSGWNVDSVWGGAKGSSGPNGFFAGGEDFGKKK